MLEIRTMLAEFGTHFSNPFTGRWATPEKVMMFRGIPIRELRSHLGYDMKRADDV